MGLVVTRRPGEAIEIGDPFGDIITVRVVGGMEGQVRLKIDAPLDVAVHREEIGAKIRRGGRPAVDANQLGPQAPSHADLIADLKEAIEFGGAYSITHFRELAERAVNALDGSSHA